MTCRSALILLVILPFGVGYALGPKSIERTHAPYTAAVQRVEEEQFLRNIVRIRYLESPTGLNIASIAAQYDTLPM